MMIYIYMYNVDFTNNIWNIICILMMDWLENNK